MRGEIECMAPSLKLLRQKVMEQLRFWPEHEFPHVKRDWNQSADSLARAALQKGEGSVTMSGVGSNDLIMLNRLPELLVPRSDEAVTKIAAVARSYRRRRAKVLQEAVVQRIRMDRIVRALASDAKTCAKIAEDYEIDEAGLLFYCPPSKRADEDRDLVMRLVVPESLQNDFLHHYHTSLKGGHQGIGRTYQRIRAHFHWRGLYQSVQLYVGQCVECETGKGRPTIQGESPGNLQATYRFQIIAMDHVPSMFKSYKDNTELLIWVDLFTGRVCYNILILLDILV
ncbi:hypothetical protein F443_18517 [Phytophthora nicotianae P1569]|uniref:Integrase zinc-binding domain-containing protein n=2 Tax=Phytophthora nicotianae TaxID=4792 RepID=V9E7M2_PHYNI|nr:hypothetical protein F443_18517 [Phytophthora nicotianae P1569]ETO63854.1 hypothetical protein F444_18508 [Phytophthora nicotianae P1976]